MFMIPGKLSQKSPKSQYKTLPDHLILEHILPRLPVKSLIRFKSVCKNWLFTISTHQFAKTHLKFSPSPTQFILIDGNYLTSKGLFLRADQTESGCCRCFHKRKPSGTLLGSCNGLLCFRHKINGFAIWNPTTGELWKTTLHNDVFSFDLSCGFGYASSIDDYKIVVLFYSSAEINLQVYVYSLRNGKWKKIEYVDEYDISFVSRNESVWINSVLYWCPQAVDERIVSFDLDREKLAMNPYMDWLRGYDSIDLVRVLECLSCCCHNDGSAVGVYDVWMLKKHGNWNSWEMLYTVDFGGVPAFSFGDIGSKCLVYDMYIGHFKLANLTRDGLEIFDGETKIHGHTAKSWTYAESLISPHQIANSVELESSAII